MHHQSGGFVDDHQVLILIDDIKGDILGDDVVVVSRTIHHHGNHFARLHLVAALHRLSVGHHIAHVGCPLDAVARRVHDALAKKLIDSHRCLSLIDHHAEVFVQLTGLLPYGFGFVQFVQQYFVRFVNHRLFVYLIIYNRSTGEAGYSNHESSTTVSSTLWRLPRAEAKLSPIISSMNM